MQKVLQRYKDLQDIIAILGIEELSEEDKLIVRPRPPHPALPHPADVRGRGLHRHAAAQYVKREDTVRGFKEILDGKHDNLPEQAFYMVGTIEQAVEKAAKMAAGLVVSGQTSG